MTAQEAPTGSNGAAAGTTTQTTRAPPIATTTTRAIGTTTWASASPVQTHRQTGMVYGPCLRAKGLSKAVIPRQCGSLDEEKRFPASGRSEQIRRPSGTILLGFSWTTIFCRAPLGSSPADTGPADIPGRCLSASQNRETLTSQQSSGNSWTDAWKRTMGATGAVANPLRPVIESVAIPAMPMPRSQPP